MSDLIERDKAIEKLKENVVEMGGDDFSEMGVHIDDIESVINSIPSARPKGEWIEQEDCWQCSECGDEYVLEVGVKPIDAKMNYCPNCGCAMTEREGE